MKRIFTIIIAMALVMGLMPAIAVMADEIVDPWEGVEAAYAFVPNSDEASVSKVDLAADPPAEVARYSTVGNRTGLTDLELEYPRPNRIDIDSEGNAWVLNTMSSTASGFDWETAQGSVVRISGSEIAGEEPGVTTSNSSAMVLPDVRVTYIEIGDLGDAPRTINVVEEGDELYLWIGFYGGRYYEKFAFDPAATDPEDMLEAVAGTKIDVAPYTPYSTAVDGDIMWVSCVASSNPFTGVSGILRFDTDDGTWQLFPFNPTTATNRPYDIKVHPDGNVWVSDATASWTGTFERFFGVYDDDGIVHYVSIGAGSTAMRGFYIDEDGTVWATTANGRVLMGTHDPAETDNYGWTFEAVQTGLPILTGVGPDAAGYLWLIMYGSNEIGRLDPADPTGDILPVDVGKGPYAYGGFVQLAPPEELTVTKTVETSYNRTHEWDIDKWVDTEYGYTIGEDEDPKIWLYTDGSGNETATWSVNVTYEGYEDSGWNVSGNITIYNSGGVAANITGVVDELCGEEITITWPEGTEFPYLLEPGDSLVGTYSEDTDCEGVNVVMVTTTVDEYASEEVAVVWGEPDEEINKTVNIKDISDLFGEVDLGNVTAPNGDVFTYTKDFAWENYGAENCGSFEYDNTATIVQTGQNASATLKVNVQCYLYETAFAKGDDAVCFIPYFGNWGWTNPIMPGEYEWDLWAGAGQCDTSKGTLVGSVTVVYDAEGNVTVVYNLFEGYSLEETHVYAGTTMFPQQQRGRRTVDTVAPGQYYNDGPFDGSEVYVIAHAVVGIPDPEFGPDA